MGVTEIGRQVGIHKSKAFSILNTLIQFGFIIKDLRLKTYSLGPSLIFLSRNVLDNLSYPEVVAPFLENLAKETNGTAVFGLINGAHLFVVAKHEGNQNIGFSLRLGHRFHITLGAHGKAIVAYMSQAERKKILARRNLYFCGDPSRMDMKRLGEEIAKCQKVGYAQDVGEITPGVSVVSAPVFGLHEKMVGCIILLGTFPESMIEKYGLKIVSIAREVSHKFGAHPEHLPFPPH